MKNSNLLINILLAAFIAGTLDILAAIFLLAGGNAAGVFKFIASGVFGKAALQGGSQMIAWGVVFHYIIALGFTTVYFLLYPNLPFLQQNKWLNAAVYGIVVWTVMNLIVLPLTQVSQRAFSWREALINMAILIVCVGLPVSLLADRFYAKAE